MEDIGDLKAILHSKRANIFYLEHCRVLQKDGRVVFLTEAKKLNQYWNIPIANTTVILLGSGTSITQAAVRMLASAGVMIGFCGGGGTPLFTGNADYTTEIEWFSPQSEYRPTEYVQGWVQLWGDDSKRLWAAKHLQTQRMNYLCRVWQNDRDLREAGFFHDDREIEDALANFRRACVSASENVHLLGAEARFTKSLYRFAMHATSYGTFTRERSSEDPANGFLDNGNYLAYGLGASALWVLGIPHAFAVMHGKTRRGALVFDAADLIKDAIVLPTAFVCAQQGNTPKEFRQEVLRRFTQHKALDFIFSTIKDLALDARRL